MTTVPGSVSKSGHVPAEPSRRLAARPDDPHTTTGMRPAGPHRQPTAGSRLARAPTSKQTLAREDLADAAAEVLRTNWTGKSTVPSRTLYPHQWSWDSAFVALGTRHLSARDAQAELDSLLAAQWKDGRLPHIVFDPAVEADAYFPGPDFWRSERSPAAPTVRTSGLVQPPVHALAVWAVFTADPLEARRTGFLQRSYPRLAAWHRYLTEHRDFGGRGLVSVVHPWESGMDNSPSWDAALTKIKPMPGVKRQDLRHANEGDRPTNAEYARYAALAATYGDRCYLDRNWEPPFALEDPLTNALLIRSELVLADIAGEIGGNPGVHIDRAAHLTKTLVDELYDPKQEIFFARDVRSWKPIRKHTVAGLAPLVVPDLPMADALVRTATGPRFGLGDVRMVPSYDLTATDFSPSRYWRGPSWFNIAWLIRSGLSVNGFGQLADQLSDSILGTVAEAGFREYVDPHTGAGHGSGDFSWTAAVVLDLLRDHR